MNSKNRINNVGEGVDIEIPDTAHQISSGLSFVFSLFLFCYINFTA